MFRKSSRSLTGLVVLIAALAGLVAGLLAAITSPVPAELFGRLSYQVRHTLGLEKNWFIPPGPSQAAGRTPRTCPSPDDAVVLVIGGQSNASNVVPVLHKVQNDVAVWFDGKCYAADDPILGATADGGSLWSLLGDQLADQLNRPVLMIVGAVGGTQFADWLDSRSGYYQALSDRIATAHTAGYTPDMILWHQGETDAIVERNMERLTQTSGEFIDRLLTDIPDAPLYLFQASRCIGPRRVNGVPEVVNVLQGIAEVRPRVITGLNTDTLGRDYRWDTCHFNSFGRARIVSEILFDLVTRLSLLHETPED